MAVVKFLKLKSGNTGLDEVPTTETSAGAADASKIPNTNAAGVLDPSLLNAVAASAGGASAGKVAQLDGTGRLDSTLMPVGIGAETASLTATEALAAGDNVNVHATGVRKADASNGRRAHGIVLAGVSNGALALVYFRGFNTQLASRTLGATQYLGAAGATTETPPTTSGYIVQEIGVAISVSTSSFQPRPPITLA